MEVKKSPQLAFEAEKGKRYREAALHWMHAKQECTNDRLRQVYIKNMVRCEMRYTKRLKALNS